MSSFTCQGATWEELLSWLRESFLQPSQICGFLILRLDSGSQHDLTLDLTTHCPGLDSPSNTASVCFYPGGTWPESSVPSQCGTTPTPAAWRCWTTPWRSREVWRVWRTSWRRWPTPSAFCHDDPTTVCVRVCCCLLPALMCFTTCVQPDMFLCCFLT